MCDTPNRCANLDVYKSQLLELAAITLKMDENGNLQPDQKCHFHIEPVEGANINPESLKFNGIDIHNPLRGAVSELDAITGSVSYTHLSSPLRPLKTLIYLIPMEKVLQNQVWLRH